MIQYVDLGKDEWHGRFERGDVFRTLKPSTCGVCGCKSNLYEMGGYPTRGPRLICPGDRKYPQLHEAMERKQDTLAFNGRYGIAMLPRTVIADLKKELANDRKKFKKIKPDVVLERQKN